MKINQKTFYVLAMLAVMSSCAGIKRPQNDCSGIFENNLAKPESKIGGHKNIECKVLTVKFSADTTCEVSGSDKIDNFIATLDHRGANEVVLSVPLKALMKANSMSYSSMVKYYFMIKNFTDRVDSGLLDSLKDYRYKGMSCNTPNGKLKGWIGDGNILVIIDDKRK